MQDGLSTTIFLLSFSHHCEEEIINSQPYTSIALLHTIRIKFEA